MAKSSKRKKASRKATKAPRRQTMASDNTSIFRAGRRKASQAGYPAPRTTTHKKRATWFQARAAWPHREPSARALLGERSRVAASLAPLAGTAQWELVGPTNVGGRMTSVCCPSKKPNTIWAGAAGGGVWKSDDGGQHWRGLWHSQPTLNIGSASGRSDQSVHRVLWNREANLSADSIRASAFFNPLTAAKAGTFLRRRTRPEYRARIGCLVVDPFDATHICLGGVTHTTDGSDGMFVSRDSGVSWGRLTFPGSGSYRCHAIVFHPTVRDTLFATISARGTQSGIWKSTDGGASWTHLKNGLPSTEKIGRTSLAIAPSQPSVIYALSSTQKDAVLGVFSIR